MSKLIQFLVLGVCLVSASSSSYLAEQDILGGTAGWDKGRFITVDDRLRGGSSQSNIETNSNNTATFFGNLDTKTLGGAGFASQSIESSDPIYDFSSFTGFELNYLGTDNNRYSIILSNEYSSFSTNGSKSSVVDFQYDFKSEPSDTEKSILLKFDQFIAVSRGKPVTNPTPILDLGVIRKLSIQIRSFFETQTGIFNINLISLSAV